MHALRRRGRLVATALALVMIGVVAAAWLLPPLSAGGGGVASGPPGSDQGPDSAAGAPVIRFVPSGRVGIGVEVRNSSFVPVTIRGLQDGGVSSFLLDDVRLVLGTDATYIGIDDDHLRPFEPVTLAPGATQLIGVVGWFPGCADARPRWSTGAGITIYSLSFEVRVAGILPTQAVVPLPAVVELHGDADAACS